MELLIYRRKGSADLIPAMLGESHDTHLILSGVRIGVEGEMPRVYGGIADHYSINGTFIPEGKVSQGMSLADAEAVARYQGEDFEAYLRESGRYGVRRKSLSNAPDFGTTKVDLDTTYRATMWHKHFTGIPQGQPVPY